MLEGKLAERKLKSRVTPVPSACLLKIVLCWREQHGREDRLIQDLLRRLQHFCAFCVVYSTIVW